MGRSDVRGTIWLGDRSIAAHRFSYELANGPIPVGFVIDHLCENKKCVNPDHLEMVSLTENNKRNIVRRAQFGALMRHWREAHKGCRKCRTLMKGFLS